MLATSTGKLSLIPYSVRNPDGFRDPYKLIRGLPEPVCYYVLLILHHLISVQEHTSITS